MTDELVESEQKGFIARQISYVITDIYHAVSQVPFLDNSIEKYFLCTEFPEIPFPEYIDRFQQYGRIQDETLTYGLLLMDRALKTGLIAHPRALHK